MSRVVVICMSLSFFIGIAGMSEAVDLDDFRAATFIDSSGFSIPYRLFVPSQYDESKSYPIVMYLHGAAASGTDNQKQLTKANRHGSTVWAASEYQATAPAFVLAPQAPVKPLSWGGGGEPSSEALRAALELLDHLEGVFSIDVRREYVTGQSMGGFGTWAALASQPARFAAGVPLAAGGDPNVAETIAHVPKWVFHGLLDDVVSVEESQKMVSALLAAGDEPRYTVYESHGHGIGKTVYNTPELHAWLFAQLKSMPRLVGDFNLTGVLDVGDLHLLNEAIGTRNDVRFDVNGDRQIDDQDLVTWVTDLKQVIVGDVNFDGEFESGDLVVVFESGKYETDLKAIWTEGDWNFDGRFSTEDLIVAFTIGEFENGSRQKSFSVPEPCSMLSVLLSAFLLFRKRERGGQQSR